MPHRVPLGDGNAWFQSCPNISCTYPSANYHYVEEFRWPCHDGGVPNKSLLPSLPDRHGYRDTWTQRAIALLLGDADSAPQTPLRKFPLPVEWGIDLYLKDESTHESGSLKHRLARSLMLQGLVSGCIGPETLLVDASSGSTAISEAYFAAMLGLEFVTAVPESTSPSKLNAIEKAGGRYITVPEAGAIVPAATLLCKQRGGYFLDQFANATPATDWRRGNIASELLDQLRVMKIPAPRWIVIGAGTGGTATMFGRFCRYEGLSTKVALADPEGSSYSGYWQTGVATETAGSRIEGIGRPFPEPSFIPSAIDAAVTVADASSIAAMRLLADRTGILAGGSTGTNLAAALVLVQRMREEGQTGSVVTLICDSAERYGETYYDQGWLAAYDIHPEPEELALRALLDKEEPADFLTSATFLQATNKETRE